VSECVRLFGADHTDTLTARRDLASSYRAAGRAEEGRKLQEALVADLERLLGPDHPATQFAIKTLEDNP